MERLTKRIAEHVYYTKGKYTDTIPAECEIWDIRDILNTLADYEDLGYSPAELADQLEIFKAYRHVCGGYSPEEIAELAEKLKEWEEKGVMFTDNVYAARVLKEQAEEALKERANNANT